MTSDDLSLHLPSGVRESLLNLLSVSLELGPDADVIDHVGVEPWGDLDSFRETVYDPLHGRRAAPRRQHVTTLTIRAHNLEPFRTVLDGLAEGFSGGVPWVPLSERERTAVKEVLAELKRADRSNGI
jgi:hypothetical protein